MYSDNSFAEGYAIGRDSNNNGNGSGWGADGAWWIVILLIFGWGGFGNGFGGFGGNAGGALTRGELCQDMNFQSVENGVRGIQQGLCDGFYSQNTTMLQGFNGLNTNMMNGFHGVDNAVCTLGYQTQQGFNTLGSQLANCCCETQRQIERGFCDTNYALATNTTAIIQNAHNDTDRVLNKLCEIESTRQQEKISALQNKVQSLEFAASQAAQNTYLVDQIRPCSKPVYITCNPYAYQYQNYNTGCCNQGCGC